MARAPTGGQRRGPAAEDRVASRPRVPRGVWALGFVSLLMDVSSESIHALLPLFLVGSLGIGVTTVGLLEGLAEATALAVKVVSGTLSDRWRRRKPLAVAGYALGALAKPLFAIAPGFGLVLTARLVDRVGKGIRGAPRDALVADLTPSGARGAAFGLRQALDTVGAVLGPLLAGGLMVLAPGAYRRAFWVAVVPAVLAVLVLLAVVREPARPAGPPTRGPRLQRRRLAGLGRPFWAVTVVGVAMALARFSEAFLVLRAQDAGLALAFAPLALVAMNVVYAATAYPIGRLSDRIPRARLLAWGLAVLVAADLVVFAATGPLGMLFGVALWGAHLGMTQGLLAALVADAAPGDARGTAFGVFYLASGAATLVASLLAGVVWDVWGGAATFAVGAGLAALAWLLLRVRSLPAGAA